MVKKPKTHNVIEGLEIVSKTEKTEPAKATPQLKMTDSEKMIELLEAIDWKLWMLFKKFEVDDE
jgi:hypothetical protein